MLIGERVHSSDTEDEVSMELRPIKGLIRNKFRKTIVHFLKETAVNAIFLVKSLSEIALNC